jgi:hypothetical protein
VYFDQASFDGASTVSHQQNWWKGWTQPTRHISIGDGREKVWKRLQIGRKLGQLCLPAQHCGEVPGLVEVELLRQRVPQAQRQAGEKSKHGDLVLHNLGQQYNVKAEIKSPSRRNSTVELQWISCFETIVAP